MSHSYPPLDGRAIRRGRPRAAMRLTADLLTLCALRRERAPQPDDACAVLGQIGNFVLHTRPGTTANRSACSTPRW